MKYQVCPRTDLEDVLSGAKDGGEHMPLWRAQQVAADRAGIDTASVVHFWNGQRRPSRRLYVQARRPQAESVVIVPAMPRLLDADGNPPRPGQLSLLDLL